MHYYGGLVQLLNISVSDGVKHPLPGGWNFLTIVFSLYSWKYKRKKPVLSLKYTKGQSTNLENNREFILCFVNSNEDN